ncbi:hypothetical protein AMEX_G718 [Astyanax mexicanus]|uniref:CHAT domain-containing protein n=1 Tax=Astyanax mexicanus TaxID=7994 RepID=A0A8T2MCJ7_ASTMX|nr:hypothetical protein AMEX_G718 [Astyanax mexicanus]
MYNDPAQIPLVEKAGLKKLYIRGKFQVKDITEKTVFLWDNGRKDVKALGEFILKIFKPDAAIVVFPDDLHTYIGFQFQKEFEEVVQAKNEGITVGRAVINVYLGLGEQGKEEQVHNLFEDEIKKQTKGKQWDHEKDEKYSSIFAQYNSNKFSFRTVFSEQWNPDLEPVNIYQVKIQEADSVVVKLMSVCTPDQNGLKVGGYKEQDLADILLKLLHVDDVKTHPKQRIRVELPENCGTAEQRVAFSGELVDKLQMRTFKAYGKEPVVHMHVYSSDMINDINHIKKAYPDDIFAKIKYKIENQVNDQNRKSVSSAKELYIHLHCHGTFSHNDGTFCGKGSESLAVTLSEFVITLLENSVPKTAIIILHGCEAGSEDGEKYVIGFLTKLDELLHTHKLTVQDSLSYMYETSQIDKYTQVMVPFAQHFGPESNVNENEVFARFTVRTVKTAEGYRAFHVLPLTEYSLIYK